jgi:hypothetical protein
MHYFLAGLCEALSVELSEVKAHRDKLFQQLQLCLPPPG